MSQYFARLAQRSGIQTAPVIATAHAPAEKLMPVSATSPLEQNVEVTTSSGGSSDQSRHVASSEGIKRSIESSSSSVDSPDTIGFSAEGVCEPFTEGLRGEVHQSVPATDPLFRSEDLAMFDRSSAAVNDDSSNLSAIRPLSAGLPSQAPAPHANTDSGRSESVRSGVGLRIATAASGKDANEFVVELTASADGEHIEKRRGQETTRAGSAIEKTRIVQRADETWEADGSRHVIAASRPAPPSRMMEEGRSIDRQLPTEPIRPHQNSAAPQTRGPVEIHIGAITLQVHAPKPVPRSAPAISVRGDGFALHRHYIRAW
jgi:hypothetical protein